MSSPPDITGLLQAWKNGDRTALDRLMPMVYGELRRLGRAYLRQDRPGHTLQSAALVNEAYLRLSKQKDADVSHRTHFFAIAAHLMRQVLVDYARTRHRLKRGGAGPHISLDETMAVSSDRLEDILALDEALQKLAATDERKSKVVELRFFGGLSVEETAEVLNVSPNTVIRDWSLAKAWLNRELRRIGDEPSTLA